MLGVPFFDPYLPRMLATTRPMDVFGQVLGEGMTNRAAWVWGFTNDPDIELAARALFIERA